MEVTVQKVPVQKKRWIAVLLPFFVGPLAYLYTYAEDRILFWRIVGLSLGLVLLSGVFGGLGSYIMFSTAYGLSSLVWIGGGIMALIHSITRPDSFYETYGAKHGIFSDAYMVQHNSDT